MDGGDREKNERHNVGSETGLHHGDLRGTAECGELSGLAAQ